MKNSEQIKLPKQDRSQQTMDRIMRAAASILQEKNFEEITIAEIVERAHTSVGAFYGRFKDKEGLLEALDAHFFAEFEKDITALLLSPGWSEQPVSKMIRDICRLLVDTYSRQTGVLRSLNLKARLHNDTRFRKREERAWSELFPRLKEALLTHQAEFSHPDPAFAIQFGFQQMFFTMREVLIWEPLRSAPNCTNDGLISELTRAYLSYLGCKLGDYS